MFSRRNVLTLGAALGASTLGRPVSARPSAPTLISSKVGNPRPTGYDVVVHTAGATRARAVLRPYGSGEPLFTTEPAKVNDDGYAEVPVDGLDPLLRYEHDLELKYGLTWYPAGSGSAWTAPTPGSVVPEYRIGAWGCCANRLGTSVKGFQRLDEFGAHLLACMGDPHYGNVDSTHYRDHLEPEEKQLTYFPAMASSLAHHASVRMGSDHDWDGGDNSNHGGPWTKPNIKAYKMSFPHLPIPTSAEAQARCGTLMAGRTRLIFVDTRSGKRTAGSQWGFESDTALGLEQRAWVRGLLQDAATNPDVQSVGFFSDFVWGGTKLGNKPDCWAMYAYERALLAEDMAAVKAAGKGGFISQGDNHGGFGDDGTNNPYGGFAVFGMCGMYRNSGNFDGDIDYQHWYPAKGVDEHIELFGQVTLRDDGTQVATTLELVDALTDEVRFTVEA